MASVKTRNPKEEFKQLLRRKELLEKVLRAADRVEQLHSGLHAAQQMGADSGQIDQATLRFYEGLSDAVKSMPTPKVQGILKQLEDAMAAKIHVVMAYADQDIGQEDLDDSFEESALELISYFSRTTKTAVALRLMLENRGVATQAMEMPVDAEKLRVKVAQVSEQETQARQRVETDIVRVRDDAIDLLKTPNLPDNIQAMLMDTVSQMEENLVHIHAGEPIDSLPHAVEVIDAEEVPEVEAIPEVLPVIEVDEEVSIEEIDVVIEAPLPSDEKTGFGRKLGNWLNSPLDEGWDKAGKKK